MVKVNDVRELLDGYGITSDNVKDIWITNRINSIIIWIEKRTRQSFQLIKQATEYHSGTGSNVLQLDRWPITELVSVENVISRDAESSIDIGAIEVILDEGTLKVLSSLESYSNIFPKGNKNIKIIYKYGYADIPDDIKEAVIFLVADQTLGFLANRGGGGSSLSVEAYSVSYGNRGKYGDLRNDISRVALSIIKTHTSGVVGG